MARGKLEPGMAPPFEKGNTAGRGRPKNPAAQALMKVFGSREGARIYRSCKFTKADLDNWREIILGLTAPQATAVAKHPDIALFPKAKLFAILTEMKNGKADAINRIVEELYGKSVQRSELTGPDGADLIPARTLTAAEMKDLMKELEDEY